MDSQLLLVFTAVGTLATAIFTGWPIAQRAMDRPRPRWKVVRALEAQSSYDDAGWIRVRLTNVGDGAAFDVETHVIGSEGLTLSRTRSAAARLKSGEFVDAAVKIATTIPTPLNTYGVALPYMPTPAMLEGIVVRVTWTHPPHRGLRRRRSYRLVRLEASPTVQ